MRLFTSLLLLLISQVALAAYEPQVGDLIFHESKSRQAKAIEEAQGSPYTHMGVVVQDYRDGKWYVYEAVQPVKVTRLNTWIKRGKRSHYLVKRIPKDLIDMSNMDNQRRLLEELSKYMGKDYDIFFKWSDDEIYCSELPYKAYERAFGIEIGTLQRFKDLNLNGPSIRRLIRERERLQGHPIDLNERVITPASLLGDLGLVGVEL